MTSKNLIKKHFEVANPLWYLLVVPSMLYVSLLAYMPHIIPFEKIGTLGLFSKYLHSEFEILTVLIFWAAWASHILEAIYVVKTGNDMSISRSCLNKWFFQTLLIGYPSTKLMLDYKNKKKSK